jgi:hypothetical protein
MFKILIHTFDSKKSPSSTFAFPPLRCISQAASFKFSVIALSFVVHFPHAKSEVRLVWDLDQRGKGRNDISHKDFNNKLYERYLKWLGDTYSPILGHHTPICANVEEAPTWTQRQNIKREARRKGIDSNLTSSSRSATIRRWAQTAAQARLEREGRALSN